MPVWNPWHGCRKYSSGCKNCYVYRRDSAFGKDSSVINKTKAFDLPLKKDRNGRYKLLGSAGVVYTCMTSDFFIEEADEWRSEIWKMISLRSDLHFIIITKRIVRMSECLPENWGSGYDNVTICCTCENQEEADRRLPVFLELPIKHRHIIEEPMLSDINISKYLETGKISRVICGGESGDNARICDYEWILDSRKQCEKTGTEFYFKQTGAKFRKDGRLYNVKRKYQMSQAQKAGINIVYEKTKDHSVLFFFFSGSSFRSRFRLSERDVLYIKEKGIETIRSHANDFITKRLAPEYPENDGKQTPMRGHPVFIAQHACACCCRDCLYKWHRIEKGRKLSENEINDLVDIVMEWIQRQSENYRV